VLHAKEKNMTKQISTLSPHQNGKVFAVLMAVASLFLFVPMALMMAAIGPPVDQHGNEVVFPTGLLIVMPFLYAVVGYISVAIGCALYNFLFKYIGGFEFETIQKDT
jgi:hypothetical protein